MDSIIADIMIIVSGVVLLAAVGMIVFSVIRSQKNNKRPKVENGVPTRMIALGTVAGVIVIALPTLLIGSFTDMCIITGTAMLFIALVAVIFSKILSATLRKRV